MFLLSDDKEWFRAYTQAAAACGSMARFFFVGYFSPCGAKNNLQRGRNR
jgi:hypothetical protein